MQLLWQLCLTSPLLFVLVRKLSERQTKCRRGHDDDESIWRGTWLHYS